MYNKPDILQSLALHSMRCICATYALALHGIRCICAANVLHVSYKFTTLHASEHISAAKTLVCSALNNLYHQPILHRILCYS